MICHWREYPDHVGLNSKLTLPSNRHSTSTTASTSQRSSFRSKQLRWTQCRPQQLAQCFAHKTQFLQFCQACNLHKITASSPTAPLTTLPWSNAACLVPWSKSVAVVGARSLGDSSTEVRLRERMSSSHRRLATAFPSQFPRTSHSEAPSTATPRLFQTAPAALLCDCRIGSLRRSLRSHTCRADALG